MVRDTRRARRPVAVLVAAVAVYRDQIDQRLRLSVCKSVEAITGVKNTERLLLLDSENSTTSPSLHIPDPCHSNCFV